MLLARLGWEHLLVSARPQTSDLPKAHVLNQRAMEVLDDVGVAAAIAERSTPAEQMAATAFYAGFACLAPDYGRRLARLESWGARGADENWRAASPWRQLNLPQIRLEPLLKARAEELSPGRIRFGHELTGLEEDGEGVRARIRDNASGRRYEARCQYLLGADGGRRVAGLTGAGYEGLGVVTQTATLHVSADFSPWAKDPDVLIRWIFSPQAGVLVVMVPMGPERWGPASEEWVIHLNYPAGYPRAESDAQAQADARQALGVPDLPMKIHKITRWSVEAVMASSFRAGLYICAAGRGAPPPAHRRAGTDQRDPRRAEPVLETRAGAGPGLTGAAGHLPGRTPPGRSAQRPAVAGERGQPFRDRRGARHLP